MAQAVGDAGGGRRPGGGKFPVGPEQSGKPGGADDQRHGEIAAEQAQALVADAAAGEGPRQELDGSKGGLVAAQGHLVLGAAVDEVEQRARQLARREPTSLANAVDAPLERCRHACPPSPRRC